MQKRNYYHQGTVKLRTINNPRKGELISPSTQTTVIPLSPSNVTAVEKEGIIIMTATVYVDAVDDLDSVDVYITQLLKEDGLGVYIVYDYIEEIPTSLYPYTISFDIQDPKKSIKKIKSYLWDEDPVGSRGTVTTVQEV